MNRARFLDFVEARTQARAFLPRALFDYIDRGTEGEIALAALRQGFDARRIVPRVLRSITAPDISAQIMGRRYATPFIVAPTALAGLVRHDGEAGMARAARRVGVPFCVATQSSISVEAIAARAGEAELWFQLYVWRDRTETWRLLDRVAAQDIKVLVLSADTPASPKKVHNLRNGFGIPLRPSLRLALDLAAHPCWTLGVMGRYWCAGGLPSYANYPGSAAAPMTASLVDPRFALDTELDIAFLTDLRRRWSGKLVLKGILAPEDAMMAFDVGCDAVVVSAHGGRNHDSAVCPLDMLPLIRQAAGAQATILADSGIRRGSDAAKLLAAGADGVLLGRAPLYGLASNGEDGAVAIIEILSEELRAFLRFSGVQDLDDLGVQSRHLVDGV